MKQRAKEKGSEKENNIEGLVDEKGKEEKVKKIKKSVVKRGNYLLKKIINEK